MAKRRRAIPQRGGGIKAPRPTRPAGVRRPGKRKRNVSPGVSGQRMAKYSDRAVNSRWSRPAARPRRPVMPGSPPGNRHSSSRPPAAPNAAAQTGHHGHRRFRDGLDDEHAGAAGVRGEDLAQQRRPRVLREFVGRVGRHQRRGARRHAHAQEVAAADLGVEAQRAARPPRFVGRPRMTLDAEHPGPRHALQCPRGAGHARSASEVGNQVHGCVRRRRGRGRRRARPGSGGGRRRAQMRHACPRRRARRPSPGGRAAPRRPTTGPSARVPPRPGAGPPGDALPGRQATRPRGRGARRSQARSRAQCTMTVEFPHATS